MKIKNGLWKKTGGCTKLLKGKLQLSLRGGGSVCVQGVPKAGEWGETSTRDGEHPDNVLGVGQQQHTEITIHTGALQALIKNIAALQA